MALATKIENRVSTVLTKFGDEIWIYAGSQTMSSGDATWSYTGSYNTKGISSNNRNYSEFEDAGELPVGDLGILCSGDVVVGHNDLIWYQAGSWRVKEKRPVRLQDTVVAQRLTLVKLGF